MTIVFGVIFWLSLWLLGLAVVINLALLVATGQPNVQVSSFAQQLAEYQRQIIAFATLTSNKRPFPFGEAPPSAQVSNPVPAQDLTADEGSTSTSTEVKAPQSPAEKTPASPKKKAVTRKKRKKKTAKKVNSSSADTLATDSQPESDNADTDPKG